MKTLETDPRLPKWLNDFLNWWSVDTKRITSRAWAYGIWGTYWADEDRPEWLDTLGNVIHPNQYQSMIWNAERFERIVYVDGKARGWAWSTRPRGKTYKHTFIFGVKLNGRQAITMRLFHSDKASAAGTLGANLGQSIGDEFGPA